MRVKFINRGDQTVVLTGANGAFWTIPCNDIDGVLDFDVQILISGIQLIAGEDDEPDEEGSYQPKVGDKFTVCYEQDFQFRKYVNEVLECTYSDELMVVFRYGSSTSWFKVGAVELRPLTDAAVKALQA